jgi:hypothetical protein
MKHKAKLTAIAGIALLSGVLSTHEAYSDVVLKHRYTFDETSGTTVTDSQGSANGTLINTTGTSGFNGTGGLVLGAGNDGLNAGNGDYVNFPNGMVTAMDKGAGSTTFTFEIWWSKSDADLAWSRVFDFGNSSGGEDGSGSSDGYAQLVLAAENGGNQQRFEFRRQDINGVWGFNGPTEPDVDVLTHSVVVWDEPNNTYSYFVNGALVGSATLPWTITDGFYNADESPADVNNWLGRSQWGDTLFQGTFEEFRIYESSLDPFEVASTYLGGPDNPAGADIGALTQVTVEVTGTQMVIGETVSVSVVADFANLPEDFPGIDVSSLSTFSSDNESVATVDAFGVVSGLNPGTANITAAYEGSSEVIQVEVVIPNRPPAVLAHRYTFDQDGSAPTALKDTVDTSGAWDGELIGGATFNGDGTMSLDGVAGSYVNFPNGIVSSLGANGTIETWVTLSSSGGVWQRVWDFGSSNLGEDPPLGEGQADGTWFYNPVRGGGDVNSGNGGRLEWIPGDGGSQFTIDPPNAFTPPIDEEYHVLSTYNYDQRVAQIWVDGRLAGTATIGADSPMSDLEDINNWLGRSQWGGDSHLTGTFNEFRIYSGVPSELEIAISRSAGPDTIVADPGAITGLTISATSSTAVEGTFPVAMAVNADFANVPSPVNLTSVPGVTVASSDPSVARILNNPTRILPVGPGQATISATYDGADATPLTFTVNAAPANTAPVISNRYPFEGNANDVEGGANGSLISIDANPGGVWENGGITLAGNGYIDLPNFLFGDFWYQAPDPQNLTSVTLEVFGSRNAAGNFARILDFGETNFEGSPENPPVGETYNGRTYAYLTPSGNGNLTFAMNADVSVNQVQTIGRIDSQPNIAVGDSFHIVVVIDFTNGLVRMYRNGQFAGISTLNNSETLRANLVNGVGINDVNMWLGRSQFSGDAYFNGAITEFRMYRGAMQESQVALNFACGPDNPDGCDIGPQPEIMVGMTPEGISYSWPANAVGWMPYTRSSLGAGSQWMQSNETPVESNGTKTLVLPTTGDEGYFQLQAEQ